MPTTVADVEPATWHEGIARFGHADASKLNFDAEPSDPLWSVAPWTMTEDLELNGDHVVTISTYAQAFVIQGTPTYATCNTSGYSEDADIPLSSLKGSKVLCVRTSEGCIAVLKLQAVAPNVTFYVRTYKKGRMTARPYHFRLTSRSC